MIIKKDVNNADKDQSLGTVSRLWGFKKNNLAKLEDAKAVARFGT